MGTSMGFLLQFVPLRRSTHVLPSDNDKPQMSRRLWTNSLAYYATELIAAVKKCYDTYPSNFVHQKKLDF